MAPTPTILIKDPAEVPEGALAPFVHAATLIGVQPARLEQRIRRAHSLIYLFAGERLIGVAAVKRPSAEYRHWVFSSAHAVEHLAAYPYEFGWLHILPGASGRGHVDRLIMAGREAASHDGMFATVKAEGRALLRISRRNGYRPLGVPYASPTGKHNLALIAAPALQD